MAQVLFKGRKMEDPKGGGRVKKNEVFWESWIGLNLYAD